MSKPSDFWKKGLNFPTQPWVDFPKNPSIQNPFSQDFSPHGPGLSTSSHASFDPVEPRFSTGTSSPCAEAASLLERRISCLDGEKVDHFWGEKTWQNDGNL
jgi:hypothetical protein